MFLTRISPDAFIQTEGRPFGTNTPGKPPRTFWFQTLSAIEHNMPDNWSTRLAASVLLRHWGGSGRPHCGRRDPDVTSADSGKRP